MISAKKPKMPKMPRVKRRVSSPPSQGLRNNGHIETNSSKQRIA
jgi:hypothetical protein